VSSFNVIDDMIVKFFNSFFINKLIVVMESDRDHAGDAVHHMDVGEVFLGDLGIGWLHLQLQESRSKERAGSDNSTNSHSLQRLLQQIELGKEGVDNFVKNWNEDHH